MILVTLNWLTLFVILVDSENNGKGMWHECEPAFFFGGGGGGGRGDVGRRCVRAQKAAAKETNLLLNIGLLWDLKSP